MVGKSSVVLIDGAYLSKVSNYLGGGEYLKYNIKSLAINLCKSKNLWCEDIYYYTAPPFQSSSSSDKEGELKKGYDKFIKGIQTKNPSTWVREGRLQKIGDRFIQKGVDTWIAFDLLRLAQIKEHNAIILLTADTDFSPIIKEIKNKYGTRFILAYYTDKKRNSPFSLSNYLWRVFDEKILIKKEDFFESRLNKN